MKASELMTGDLVLSPTVSRMLRVCRVKDVESNRDCVGLYDIADEDENMIGKFSKYISPIPLTAEILKTNGFRQEESGAFTWYEDVHEPEQVYVAVLLRNDGSARVDVLNHRCRYFNDTLSEGVAVHLLQQAMRLCGFREKADGFKVAELCTKV